jgi:hypothetical protein
MRDSPITDGIAAEIYPRARSAGITPANRAARAFVAASWTDTEARPALAPGKTV